MLITNIVGKICQYLNLNAYSNMASTRTAIRESPAHIQAHTFRTPRWILARERSIVPPIALARLPTLPSLHTRAFSPLHPPASQSTRRDDTRTELQTHERKRLRCSRRLLGAAKAHPEAACDTDLPKTRKRVSTRSISALWAHELPLTR